MKTNKTYEIQKLNIALMNQELRTSGLNPIDHDVWYNKGWFHIDSGVSHHRPELTAEAKKLYAQGVRAVPYQTEQRNTYFLPDE